MTLKQSIESIIEMARSDTKESGIFRPDEWYVGQILQAVEREINQKNRR